jgi:hypothetical protein
MSIYNNSIVQTLGIALRVPRPFAAFLATACASLIPLSVWGQTPTNTFPTTGNVGIGTTVPSFPLSLGPALVPHKFAIYDNGSTYYGLGLDGAAIRYEAGTNGGHTFYTNSGAVQALSILPSGNIGFGAYNPLGGLEVANGYFYQTANANGSGVNSSFVYGGLAIGWNRLAGTGETDFITNRGGGPGGFQFTDFNNSVYTNLMTIQSSGRVGIGTLSPASLLSLGPALTAHKLAVYDNGATYYGFGLDGAAIRYEAGTNGGHAFYTNAGAVQALNILPSGNVGIGTNNPVHQLHVVGTIGATEVIVSSTGADYVFAPDYHLRDLSDVSAYIQENHHLPEIPSAAEVQEKGVSLGDMQAKLLAKVEELTLHMIQEHEANARLEAVNRQLQNQSQDQRVEIDRLAARLAKVENR